LDASGQEAYTGGVAPKVTDLTDLLEEWRAGDQEALERLMPRVYDELRRLARHYLARERPGHTLQATALVHEAYLRLLDQKRVRWQSRAHFFALAATSMRRILTNHARDRRAAKRGGGALTLTLDEALVATPAPAAGGGSGPGEVAGAWAGVRGVDLIALDDALEALAALDPRQARVVELRFFAGLTIDETAEVLGISPATVKLDWKLARAWLFRELASGQEER